MPAQGARIRAHYTGRLQSNGVVFDSSYERGRPLIFQVGTDAAAGWAGLQSEGMRLVGLGFRLLPAHRAAHVEIRETSLTEVQTRPPFPFKQIGVGQVIKVRRGRSPSKLPAALACRCTSFCPTQHNQVPLVHSAIPLGPSRPAATNTAAVAGLGPRHPGR